MAIWNHKKYKLAEIDRLIDQVKITTSTSMYGFLGLHSILTDALNFHEDIFPNQAEKLVIQVMKLSEKSKLNKENFLENVSKKEREYLQQPKYEMHVVTSISIHSKFKLNAVKYNGIEIRFYETTPKFYKRAEFVDSVQTVLQKAEMPSDYKALVIILSARAEYEAAMKALNCLDFILGIWNFNLNYSKGKFKYFSAIKQAPVNKIIKGPLHTIHHANGLPINADTFYYEPDYHGPIETLYPSEVMPDIKKLEAHIKRRIASKANWGQKIIDSFIRYNRALEKYDQGACFLDLWSLLEFLTNTAPSDNYDVIVKRISNLCADSEIHKSFINYIRHIRNSMVHENEFNVHRTNIVYEIKEFVEILLLYHLTAIVEFEDIAESIQFLDLPNDEKVITKRLRLLKKFYRSRFGKHSR